MVTKAETQDHYCWTADSVRLHFRDAPGDPDRPALLCLPGLTRNLRDFDALAAHFAPRHRVVSTSFRGRGESGYAKDPLTYVPLTYLQDVGRVIEAAGLQRFIVIGTSLGGLIGLLLDVTQKGQIAGLVLNDLGPDMESAGLARVRAQVGRGNGWPTWLHAARDLAEKQAAIYPDWSLEEWLAHTKRLCRVSRQGRIIWDYDAQISAPFALPNTDAALDLWLALEAYRDRPMLSIRGALSDIFSAATQAEMLGRMPEMAGVTIANVGHAPTLMEPAALAALEAWLNSFDKEKHNG